MARNPAFFPNPDEFRPNRWRKPVSRFAFFPFSHEPRVCKGESFVRTLIYEMLRELSLRAYKLCQAIPFDAHAIRVSATPAINTRVEFILSVQ